MVRVGVDLWRSGEWKIGRFARDGVLEFVGGLAGQDVGMMDWDGGRVGMVVGLFVCDASEEMSDG